MKDIALIYRKKLKGRHSIEKVSRPLDNLYGINRVELPCDLNSLFNAIKLFIFTLKIKEKNIHITGDAYYMAAFLFWKSSIITIHDCNHYEDLKGLRRFLMGLIWYVIPLKIAKKVILISPFSKEQLVSHFKVAAKKIEIIPNGFYPIPINRSVKKNDNFTILAIGSNPHKNIKRLVEAVRGMNGFELKIVGSLPNELRHLLEKYKIPFENFFSISRKALEDCYTSSDALFFASLKEGFGLPILEAQSCGLPVITSNTTSMPYVAGSGACIVDPYNIDAIRDAILIIKSEPVYRNELITLGIENVKRFTQQRNMTSYKNLYHSVFGIAIS